ncbi:hypothetical protein [Sphingomonas sanxanigenens]|uniref:hypothetical protein n=1 Tax=Sphingomonas sanxanigenens TaxID=397260 RepID=UPI0013012301|nr:hypothetical protein [Sphingomonas sanxanigenens]
MDILKPLPPSLLSPPEPQGLASSLLNIDPSRLAAWRRAEAARKWLQQAIESGALKSSTRLDRLGSFEECPPGWWNAENLSKRWSRCSLDRANPIFGTADMPTAQYVFVDRRALADLVASAFLDALPTIESGDPNPEEDREQPTAPFSPDDLDERYSDLAGEALECSYWTWPVAVAWAIGGIKAAGFIYGFSRQYQDAQNKPDAEVTGPASVVLDEYYGVSIGVQKGPPIGVQKGPPSSSCVTGMAGVPFALVAA